MSALPALGKRRATEPRAVAIGSNTQPIYSHITMQVEYSIRSLPLPVLYPCASEVLGGLFRDTEVRRNEFIGVGWSQGFRLLIALQNIRPFLLRLLKDLDKFFAHQYSVDHERYAHEERYHADNPQMAEYLGSVVRDLAAQNNALHEHVEKDCQRNADAAGNHACFDFVV